MQRRVNDIGGLKTGPIDRNAVETQYWEAQADAIRRALGNGVVSLDEQRRATEEMDESTYERLAFFERRLEAMVRILVEKNVIDRDSLEKRIARLQANGLPA